MNDKFQKMLAKKRNLSSVERSAKHDVLKDMKSVASDALGSRLDGIKGKIVSHSQHNRLVDDALDPYSDVGRGSMGGGSHEPSSNRYLHGYSNGGTVEESPDKGDYSAVEQQSPAEAGEDSSEEPVEEKYQGMDIEEVNKHLECLLKLKSEMESE